MERERDLSCLNASPSPGGGCLCMCVKFWFNFVQVGWNEWRKKNIGYVMCAVVLLLFSFCFISPIYASSKATIAVCQRHWMTAVVTGPSHKWGHKFAAQVGPRMSVARLCYNDKRDGRGVRWGSRPWLSDWCFPQCTVLCWCVCFNTVWQ